MSALFKATLLVIGGAGIRTQVSLTPEWELLLQL